jgi:hypothetical protein
MGRFGWREDFDAIVSMNIIVQASLGQYTIHKIT